MIRHPTFFFAAAILSACAPTEAPDEPAAETEPPPDETGEPPACADDRECADDEHCDAGTCVPAAGDSSSGCSEPECDTSLCASDDDCPLGQQCTEGECVGPIGVPGCGWPWELAPVVELQSAEVTALAFVEVDADGAHALVVGRPLGAALLDPDATEVVDLPVTTAAPVVDAAAGEFNGDGIADLLLADATAVTLLAGDGHGGFGRATALPLPGAEQLQALHFRDTSMHDAAVRTAQGRVQLLFGRHLVEGVLMVEPSEVFDIAAADFDGDGLDDLAVQAGLRTFVYAGDSGGDATVDTIASPDAEAVPGIVTGLFGGRTVAVRHREVDGAWTLADGGDPATPFVSYALPITGSLGAAGDIDGDGADDLVLLDGSSLGIARGGSTQDAFLRCTALVPLPAEHRMLAVGDREGDGVAEIAVSDGSTILVLSPI